MTETVAAGVGIALMVGGVAGVGFAIYLEMIHAVPLSWWDRGIVLAPAGLIAIIGGLVLTT